MRVLCTSHPWSLDSGGPCRNDGVVLFAFARRPGMDAGNHRPWRASIKGAVNEGVVHVPSLVTGFQRSLLE